MSPQITTQSPSELATTLKTQARLSSTPVYLVVYASLVDGRSWCGDCREAEKFVDAKFGAREGREEEDWVRVVFAGDRDEWRKADNPYRQAPFNVVALPTIIKVTGEKWEQLVEGDVYDQAKLDAFVV
ncbi:Thioredoxin-like protein [Acrodontium crateriforme]|uniref:Thioredoxin-like protein n=1 Tax=Acrodontium crateriforme TaxID=150365 RepID=A0AAQ3MDF9_9PEZI|nr:Thioredoxin-like protein [Acrodontium crateriforme]